MIKLTTTTIQGTRMSTAEAGWDKEDHEQRYG